MQYIKCTPFILELVYGLIGIYDHLQSSVRVVPLTNKHIPNNEQMPEFDFSHRVQKQN